MTEEKPYKDAYLIYNRKSTDDAENQKNSLAYQRMRNVEYARHQSLQVAPLNMLGFCENGIIDEAHSGFKEDANFDIDEGGVVRHRVLRPKFLQLVKLLKEGEVRGVVFLSWDRASRNRQDNVLIQKLTRLGCDIRFVEATYDKNSSGELHQDIDGMFASHYSRVIGEKVRNASRKLRAEGRCIHAAPIGYLNQGSDSKPFDPERAPVVKRVFELYSTGEWSFVQLAKWAREQGLTQRPMRRKRSAEEIAANVDVGSLPKVARQITHKHIEYILRNPFFIGKINVEGQWKDSKAHRPLISTALFGKVQAMLKERNVSVHYVDKPFFTYRALVRCECGRIYTPYEQKGGVYYRSNCKEECKNKHPNLTEDEITTAVQSLMDKIYFTDEELKQIEDEAKDELTKVAETRDKKLGDLHLRQRKIIEDIDWLTHERISLMRTGAMTPDEIVTQEARLNGLLAEVHKEIQSYGESAPEMLQYVITFSELVKNASEYFKYALDSERREIVSQIFYEIVIKDKDVENYRAKDGFEALLGRSGLNGSPGRIRTYDQLVNSELRYRCATGEYGWEYSRN